MKEEKKPRYSDCSKEFSSHGVQAILGYMMKTALIRLTSGRFRDIYLSKESMMLFFLTAKKSKIMIPYFVMSCQNEKRSIKAKLFHFFSINTI